MKVRQGHTPFGYRIEDGEAIVCQEEADQIRQIYAGYLGGLSLEAAAKGAGLIMKHGSVKRMLQNRHYLGDDFYPAVIGRETFDAAETERRRREKALGRDRLPKKALCPRVPETRFRITGPDQVFSDPFEQAQYVYSLIESEV